MTTELTSTGTEPADDTAVSPELDAYLRAENVLVAINSNLPHGKRQLPPIPKEYIFRKRDRESVSVALHAAFELNGGVPALLQWAAENPDKFYPLYTKLAQSDTVTPVGGNTIIVQSAIPQSTLDFVSVNSKGQVVHLAEPSDLDLDAE